VNFVNYGTGSDVASGTRSVDVKSGAWGNFDYTYKSGVTEKVHGWAFDWDAPANTALTIKATVARVAQPTNGTANTSRTDVGSTYEYQDYGNNHGFDFQVVAVAGQKICLTAVAAGGGPNFNLGCQTAK
jgi:hypothetical protein